MKIFRLLEVTSTLFHKLLPTHDLMEATPVFTTLTYLHHCFLFSLCWVGMMQISLCSLFIQKGVRAFANQTLIEQESDGFSTVYWACKLSSTNHKGLILKHGYPLKLHAVFEKWDLRFFFGELICHVCLLCELTSKYICIAAFQLKKINKLWVENE